MEDNNHNERSREVTIADVIARLWTRKYMLMIWVAIGIGIGLTIGFGTPKEYKARMRMVPESTESASGMNATLAALGMGTEVSTEDAYNPTLYPDIVSSIPFITGLFDVEVQTSLSDTTYTVREYMEHHTASPWWDFSKSNEDETPKKPGEIIDPFRLTKGETALYKALNKCITTDIDKRTGEVSITVTMQDPLVAALLTDTIAARLQEYIIDYRTAKARNDLEHAITINEEAKKQYFDAQQAYADYMDRNQGLALYSAQTVRDRLNNDMQLAFNLYNQTSQRMQQCEAKVQEVTPAFAVVEPSTVPVKAYAPRKTIILAAWMLIMFLAGAVQVCFPLFFSQSFRRRLSGSISKHRDKGNDGDNADNCNSIDDTYILEDDTPETFAQDDNALYDSAEPPREQ